MSVWQCSPTIHYREELWFIGVINSYCVFGMRDSRQKYFLSYTSVIKELVRLYQQPAILSTTLSRLSGPLYRSYYQGLFWCSRGFDPLCWLMTLMLSGIWFAQLLSMTIFMLSEFCLNTIHEFLGFAQRLSRTVWCYRSLNQWLSRTFWYYRGFAQRLLKALTTHEYPQPFHVSFLVTAFFGPNDPNGILNPCDCYCFRRWWTHDDSCIYMLFDYVCGGELFSYLRNAGRFSNSIGKFYSFTVKDVC